MDLSWSEPASRRISKTLLATLLLCHAIVLTGCAALGARRPVNDEHLAAIGNIGVASELSDEFHLIHIGMTIFNNKQSVALVPDWRIDEHTKAAIVDGLDDSDRFSVGQIAGEFAGDPDNRYDIDYASLAAAAADQGYDTIVVARPTRYDNAPFHEGGYGFYERSGIGPSIRCAYSLFVLEVIDVATREELAWEWGFPCSSGHEDIEWRESFDEFSGEEIEELETRVKQGIAESVSLAVVRLRLVEEEAD